MVSKKCKIALSNDMLKNYNFGIGAIFEFNSCIGSQGKSWQTLRDHQDFFYKIIYHPQSTNIRMPSSQHMCVWMHLTQCMVILNLNRFLPPPFGQAM